MHFTAHKNDTLLCGRVNRVLKSIPEGGGGGGLGTPLKIQNTEKFPTICFTTYVFFDFRNFTKLIQINLFKRKKSTCFFPINFLIISKYIFFSFYNPITSNRISVCLSTCIQQRISLTPEPLLLSFRVQFIPMSTQVCGTWGLLMFPYSHIINLIPSKITFNLAINNQNNSLRVVEHKVSNFQYLI